MEDFIIKTGDMLAVTVTPPALVPQLVAPVPLTGTSTSLMVAGQPACLLGDELPPSLKAPLMYTAPPFVTPGMVSVQVMLMPTNMTATTQNGKPILLKGSTFQVMLTVNSPAQQPTPAGPVPDPLMVKMCTAQFITTNLTVKAG